LAPAFREGIKVAQGTVKSFAEDQRTGSVLLDDGTEIPITADAFDRSGLRMLRFGQRVRFDLEGEGDQRRVVSIDVVTMSR
jgi:2-phospho-L-lactate guanylyltransferase